MDADSLLSFLEREADHGYEGGNVFCGWIKGDGRMGFNGYQSCHASIKDAPLNTTLVASRTQRESTGYTTSIGAGGWVGDELAIPYYNWLINESPFSEVFITKDPEYVAKKGLVADSSHPSSLIVSGFICQRYCWENPQMVRNMMKMKRDFGLSYNSAFTLSHIFNIAEDSLFNVYVDSHVLLSTRSLSTTRAKNFINNCRWGDLGAPFKERPSYNSPNKIWGPESSEENLFDFVKRSLPELGAGDGVNPFSLVFKKKDTPKVILNYSSVAAGIKDLFLSTFGEKAVA